MEDAEILNLYVQRDEQAIAESSSKYGAYCQAIACNILALREDAEEAVNDTWLGAWNAIPPAMPAVLRTFLGKITRRLSLKKYRDLTREKRGGRQVPLALEELQECVPGDNSLEAAFDEKELAAAIRQFVAKMPDIERRVFLCRYWYLDAIPEICKQFGYSESKVKSMLSRSRQRLFKSLSKGGFL